MSAQEGAGQRHVVPQQAERNVLVADNDDGEGRNEREGRKKGRVKEEERLSTRTLKPEP